MTLSPLPLPLALLALASLAALPVARAQAANDAAAARLAQAAGSDAAPELARRPGARAFRPVFKWGVDGVLAEFGAFPDAPEADYQAALRATPYLLWQPAREWEFRAGARIEGSDQGGGAASFNRWRAELGDTYARYRSGDTRLTIGAQTIVWGRVDEIPLIDRASRADLTRFALDDLAERRLALPALRWEQSAGDFKLDAVLLPAFRGAALPDLRSVWSPINRHTGEVLGIAPSPGLAAFVQAAQLRRGDDGSGGAAVRLTRSGGGAVDLGLTLARTRQSLPYFQADPAAMTLTAVHPHVRFAGLDAELATGTVTWRTELGWSDGVPVTRASGQMLSSKVLEWVGAMEFFPGGEDTRVNLQLAARTVRTSQPIKELKEYLALNGEVESSFGQGRWKAGVRFNLGLNVRDVYLAPKISYLGWEPHEIYLAAHLFDGEQRTIGGFHKRHDMIAVGLKTRF
ncbi:MAG: hypothetical protein Q8M01_10220 [Rubrivivax sp.]|nr:hypothetical protein [Rubrivivax sp.]